MKGMKKRILAALVCAVLVGTNMGALRVQADELPAGEAGQEIVITEVREVGGPVASSDSNSGPENGNSGQQPVSQNPAPQEQQPSQQTENVPAEGQIMQGDKTGDVINSGNQQVSDGSQNPSGILPDAGNNDGTGEESGLAENMTVTGDTVNTENTVNATNGEDVGSASGTEIPQQEGTAAGQQKNEAGAEESQAEEETTEDHGTTDEVQEIKTDVATASVASVAGSRMPEENEAINLLGEEGTEESKKEERPAQSDTVELNDYEIIIDESNKEETIIRVNFNVKGNAEGDQVIELSKVIDLVNEYYKVPGDTCKFEITITNESGHTYVYKEGSFKLTTGEQNAQPENTSGVTGFDGQEMELNFVGALSKCEAIRNLFGVSTTSAVTIDKVVNIYAALREKGYEGDDALTRYFLDYYNKKDGTEYTTIDEMLLNKPERFVEIQGGSSSSNFQFTMSKEELDAMAEKYPDIFETAVAFKKSNGKYNVQIKWPEEKLAAASYAMFYGEILAFAFGEDDINKMDATSNWHDLDIAVRDYIDNSNGIWSKADAYFTQLTEEGLTDEEASKIAFQMAVGLDGPWMNNAYQLYYFSWYNSITLRQEDGDLHLEKVDENGEIITSDETEFKLWYVKAEVAAGEEEPKEVTYYCTWDEEKGCFVFVTEESTIWTTEGVLDVKYLLPDIVYYLQEVTAPEGYELDDTIYIINGEGNGEYVKLGDIVSGETLKVSVKNVTVSEPVTPPPTDPTPDPTPTDPTPTVVPLTTVLGEAAAPEMAVLGDAAAPETAVLGESKGPGTGDSTPLAGWMLLMAGAAAVLTIAAKKGKKAA